MSFRNVPLGLFHVEMFAKHMPHSLKNMLVDPPLFEKGRQIAFNQCSSASPARFPQLKVELLLAVKCIVIGEKLMKSSILHPDAG